MTTLEDRTLLTGPTGLDLGDSYMFYEQSIPLMRATDALFVGLRADADPNSVQRLVRNDGALAGGALASTTNARIWTVNLANPVEDLARLDLLTKAVEADPAVDFAAPTFFLKGPVPDRSYVTRDLIVQLAPNARPEDVFAGPNFTSYRAVWGEPTQFVVTTGVDPGPATLDLARQVATDPRVSWAHPDFYYSRHTMAPNDPLLSQQWHLNNTRQRPGATIGADANVFPAWNYGFDGSGVLMAVLDSGFQINHPDLINNLYINSNEIPNNGTDDDGNGYVDDVNGWDFAGNDNDPSPNVTRPNDFHGTAVAGVAVGRGDNGIGVAGAAYKAKFIPVRLPLDGQSAPASVWVESVYYSSGRAKNGSIWANVQVLNHSYGGGGAVTAEAQAFLWSATQGRGGLGALNFVSTGNSAQFVPPGSILYPSAYQGTFSIGASNDQDIRSIYSQYGDKLDFLAPSNDTIPGPAGITTTDLTGTNGYNSAASPGGDYANDFGGTSSASPLAAGIGALVLQVRPTLTIDEVRTLLRSTAKQIGPLPYVNGRNFQYGSGRIDAAAAIDQIRPKFQIIPPDTIAFAPVEGEGFSNVTLGQLTDPNGMLPPQFYTVTIDWGDSTSSFGSLIYASRTSYQILGGHRYDHAGNFPVTITATTRISPLTATATVFLPILDQALTGTPVTFQADETQNFLGKVASFTDANPRSAVANYLTKHPYSVQIIWGDDGSQTPASVVAAPGGGFDVYPEASSPHRFNRGGTFPVTVRVTDVTSTVTILSTAEVKKAQLNVQVNNIGGSTPFAEGTTFDGVIATVTGPTNANRARDFTVKVEWGDGSQTLAPVVTYAGLTPTGVGLFNINATHQYQAAGTYTITVQVNDYDGGPAVPFPAVGTADVARLPVSVDAKPLNLVDGQTIESIIGTITDGNIYASPNNYTVTIDWGDGSTPSPGTVRYGTAGAGTFDVLGTHAYKYNRLGYQYRIDVFKGGQPRASDSASVTLNDAPISATGQPIAAVEGTPFNGVVALFSVPSSYVTVGQYSASIDWGDGVTTTGSVGKTATSGNFEVRGNHVYKFGQYIVSVFLSSLNGSRTSVTNTATVSDGSILVSGQSVLGIEGKDTGPVTVATFLSTNPFADANRFSALVTWGDGQTSPGVVTGSATAGYTVTGKHVYAAPGNFPVQIALTQTTGGTAQATTTAYVSVRVEPITGGLAAGSDTGFSSTDRLTRNAKPTFLGTARANSTVQVFAQAPGQSNQTPLGTATADASGNFTIPSTLALPAGSYTITASALSASGQVVGAPTPIFGSTPLIVDLAAPQITSTALSPALAQFRIAFRDDRALDLNSLLNPVNYAVMDASRGNRTVPITRIAFDPSSTSGTSRTVLLTINGGRKLAAGNYLLSVLSAGTFDAAANTLVEKKFVAFPTSAAAPTSNYLASFLTTSQQASDPKVYVSPTAVGGALAYQVYIRGRARVRR